MLDYGIFPMFNLAFDTAAGSKVNLLYVVTVCAVTLHVSMMCELACLDQSAGHFYY